MADETFELELAKVVDESQYNRDGSIAKMRVYRFFLGKHGPFVERVPMENFDPSEIQRRIDALRLHLQTGPR